MSTCELMKQIKAARRAAVPLVAIETSDPAQTERKVCDAVNSAAPKFHWDLLSGFEGIGEDGEAALSLIGDKGGSKGDPISLVEAANQAPAKSVLFVHMANRFMDNPMFLQGVWNLRDRYKMDNRMLVLLGPSFKLPPEVANDILLLDEPLPSAEDLKTIVRRTGEDAGLELEAENVSRSVEAVQGLAAFPAEQAVAMSISKEGVHTDGLWKRKRKVIEKDPALSVWRDGERFSDIQGYVEAKMFLKDWIGGPFRPNVIVFIDEIEKQTAGAGTDLSGTSTDQQGVLLTEMQDNEYDGVIFIGLAGSGKSALAKAAGNEAGIPTIQLDLGAAKGSLVGQSEQQIRNAMKVIRSVGSGRALFIATCNSMANLSPELQRRFTLPTFFFDTPTEEEREKIWVHYINKFKLPGKEIMNRPADEGWTGAEIKQCCRMAFGRAKSIKEAAKQITPMVRKSPDLINRLRESCDGRYLSASYEGFYRKDQRDPVTGRRKLSLEDSE